MVDWGATNATESGDTLFLSATDGEGIRRFKLPSGPLEFVPGLEHIRPQHWWAVGPAGIYFYDAPEGEPGLFSYAFSSRKIARLTTAGRDLPLATSSLSVSPDGRSDLLTDR